MRRSVSEFREPAVAAGHSEPVMEMIERLRATTVEVLDTLLRPHEPMALIDYPTGGNVGDQAIWLGTTAYFASRPQFNVVYITDRFKYSADVVAKVVPPGSTVLIHGGGNLGDDYPSIQEFREHLIDRFPDRRIIQMPQTMHFASPSAAKRAAEVFNRHPDLTLLARDHRSAELANQLFYNRTILCPDMAFQLDLPRPPMPSTQAVWLARTDGERANEARASEGVFVTDWFDHTPGRLRWAPQYRARVLASRAMTSIPASPTALRRRRVSAFDIPAWRYLKPGLQLIGRGEVLITDRLHGHILASLLGVPNVLLDNSYGKLRAYYDSWTSASDRTWWAASPDDATRIALTLTRKSRC
jgi:exopolysaccharide biosynthesis predicted pyruvyltransferase EpsI